MATIRCRACRHPEGEVVLDLGDQPACEYFPRLDDQGPDPTSPLRLWLCGRCGLAQLADDADLPDEPQGVEPAALRAQRREAIAVAGAAGLLPPGAAVAEGASPHGGSWLPDLHGTGLRRAGDGERADVVVDASFGLMHATDQHAALGALVERLAPGGVLLFGFHSLAAIVRGGQWNAIRHGHYAYYSVPAVVPMLAAHGLTATHAWTFPLYGGTVLIAASRDGRPTTSVAAAVADETAAGVTSVAALRSLQHRADGAAVALRRLAGDARADGRVFHGYGAASRAVTMLTRAGIGTDVLAAVADAAPAKQGGRMPGTSVPIVSPAELVAARPRSVLVFVSELLPEVRAAWPAVEEAGGRWLDAGSGAVEPVVRR